MILSAKNWRTIMPKFDPTSYKNAYAAEKYDRVSLMLPKGMKDEIRKKDGSINGYIIDAIKEKLNSER
jgi:hypothetical protein